MTATPAATPMGLAERILRGDTVLVRGLSDRGGRPGFMIASKASMGIRFYGVIPAGRKRPVDGYRPRMRFEIEAWAEALELIEVIEEA